MDYLENKLAKNEKSIFISQQHYIIYLPTLLAIILSIIMLFPPVFLLVLLALLNALMLNTTTKLQITNKRIFANVGFLFSDKIELPIEKKSTIKLKANLIGQIFSYKTATITDGKKKVKIGRIKNHQQLEELLNK
ncbi:MAG: hypothetical protein DRQ51_04750 [Gammaproteobacteria bacterium]|nr:MAG: hypothetical protein DRQ51_04750 [Gammaproteobacteria bacterium]